MLIYRQFHGYLLVFGHISMKLSLIVECSPLTTFCSALTGIKFHSMLFYVKFRLV
jgi:hypothetical protein